MEQPDLNYLKMVIRSLLTNSPGKVTISQILNDYSNIEGCNLPYKHLGFKNVFELLENMKDILNIPSNPNMSSFITLIVDEKTSHLRELVVNQKSKRPLSRRNHSVGRSGNNHLLKSANFKSCDYSHNYKTEYSTPKDDYNARGYDHIKIKPLSSKPIGIVTPNLKISIENLCNTSSPEIININKLKNCLINHPDYKKLGTTNIEESINMLKFFIYIDKGAVHLRDSRFEIFPSKTSDKRNYTIPKSVNYLSNIVNESEELSYSELNYDDSDDMNDLGSENLNIYENEYKISQKSNSTAHINNTNLLSSNSQLTDSWQKLNTHDSSSQQGPNQLAPQNLVNMCKIGMNDSESKNNDTVPAQNIDKNTLIPSTTKPFQNKIVSKIEHKPNGDVQTILNNVSVTKYSENNILNQSNIIPELLSNKDDDQKYKNATVDNSCQPHCEKSIHLNEIYDAETILDTMKVKMRHILSKHKDGILCDNFMHVYGNEYNSHFDYSEYGFSSMRDMAYKLPSVFYVKLTEDNQESILFEACRRSELENNFDDQSLYYKNIPKTILYNLSKFFDKYRTGVKFNELMTLYCTEYGRAYEPLKYGYSSEKHMFESLDKMVEIENNELFTLNPFAYTKCLQNINNNDNYDKNSVAIPDPDFLLHYSGNDICNGKFKYPTIKLNNQMYINVIVAEIYNPSSFYIQLAAEFNNLKRLMCSLQVFYNNNEKKYKVLPILILPGLACTSIFEDSNSWHRAKVLKIVDDDNVQLLYVDYGSIEKVPKTNVRLLASQFGVYPAQGVHCGLYENNELNYPREISESFAEMVEDHQLEAEFHSPISKDGSQKVTVTLFLRNKKNNKININEKCKKIINPINKHQESVRRMIYKVIKENQ